MLSLKNVIDKAFFFKKYTFPDLPLDMLLAIGEKSSLISFKEEEILFYEGQEAHKMYFIVEGAVRIESKEKLLARCYRGDFLGEESLFSDTPRGYSAIAETAVMALSLSKVHLLTLIAESPPLALHFLQLYTTQHPFHGIKV